MVRGARLAGGEPPKLAVSRWAVGAGTGEGGRLALGPAVTCYMFTPRFSLEGGERIFFSFCKEEKKKSER